MLRSTEKSHSCHRPIDASLKYRAGLLSTIRGQSMRSMARVSKALISAEIGSNSQPQPRLPRLQRNAQRRDEKPSQISIWPACRARRRISTQANGGAKRTRWDGHWPRSLRCFEMANVICDGRRCFAVTTRHGQASICHPASRRQMATATHAQRKSTPLAGLSPHHRISRVPPALDHRKRPLILATITFCPPGHCPPQPPKYKGAAAR